MLKTSHSISQHITECILSGSVFISALAGRNFSLPGGTLLESYNDKLNRSECIRYSVASIQAPNVPGDEVQWYISIRYSML